MMSKSANTACKKKRKKKKEKKRKKETESGKRQSSRDGLVLLRSIVEGLIVVLKFIITNSDGTEFCYNI